MRVSIHAQDSLDNMRKRRLEDFAQSFGLTTSQLLARIVEYLPTVALLAQEDCEHYRDDLFQSDYYRGRIVSLEILLGVNLREDSTAEHAEVAP